MTSVYLDSAGATPLHPVAVQALDVATADGWADPGKLYGQGRRARQLLDAARQSVAETLGARPDEVSFTPNGSQALHAAVLGGLAANRRRGETFVHSDVEHSAVLHAAEWHRSGGGETVGVGVNRYGRVDEDRFAAAVARPGVALAAVQSANHEVGTRQPVTRLAELAGDVPLLVDAAQTLGHEPVPSGWSMLTGSARKWGGPSGVGILVVRKGTRWRSPWPSGTGEPASPGGLHLPAVVAAAASLRAVAAEAAAEDARLRRLTDLVRRRAADIPYLEVVGDPDDRLARIVTLSYPFEDGEPLLSALDRAGFEVSAGSSCTAATLRPSHVLEAMGVLSHGNIRVSLHRGITEADVERFTRVLPRVVAELRDAGDVADL
ncbi:cysteine desulfurase [Stackebrandtia albiflava]|uniref:Cysteine desulfurase n=1 Tax=Stackebrandtia albiflava TaxID=406432 RepID=A0A562VBF0_9ACTN|nr:aminotransferase class V-fold PLP-dependent enzyme [Stackebrandtia albiflava]TWJ15141.1 cysteine desulfurase [Stackebrandtia albiflava]